MARPAAGRRAPSIIAWTSGAVVASLLIGGAVLAQGYDAEDVPTIEASVWVSRDASGGQFARVNTDIAEIESVNDAAGLADIVQTGAAAFVVGSGSAKYWPIDAANPLDVVEGEDAASPTAGADATPTAGEGLDAPDGTLAVVTAGRYLLFTGPSPSVAIGADLTAEEPDGDPLMPPLAEGAAPYVAAVSAIADSGRVALYSVQESERRIRTYDITTAVWGEIELVEPPTSSAGLQLAFVGDRVVLYQADADAPTAWVDGAAPFPLSADIGADGLLQSSGPASDAALIASSNGLRRVALADGAELEHVEVAGTATRPVAVGAGWAAAWLASGSGALWVSGAAEPIALEIDGGEFEDNVEIRPSLVSNGDRAVLLERSTGMLWSVPDGALIPLRQWTADEVVPAPADNNVPDESPAPPESVDDAFGVRPGARVVLPVLYNDHDPNPDDVLSIDPASIEGLDPAFGTLSLVGANQTLVLDVAGTVPSATFRYRATDGKSASTVPATVTLTLRTTERSAPVWCSDYFAPDACFVDWPTPQILLGGTATFDVLKGWVDAEGDAMVIDAAVPEAGAPIVAMPTADGRLAIGHTDRTGSPGSYAVMVTIRDASGDVSEPKELIVDVLTTPDFAVKGGAILGRAGEWTSASIAEFASGGSGSYQVLDVTELTVGERLELGWNEAEGTIRLRAAAPGEYLITARAKDAATPNQHDVTLRYTVLPADQDAIAIPPLTAYVRQGEDTLIDVLGAVQNTTGKVLLVTSATPGSAPNAGPTVMAASVVDNAMIQLRSLDGIIADQLGRTDGPIGSVAFTLADADGGTYAGTISVFLVAPSGQPPIAVPDAATVRAGDVAEIAVLANDVAPRGERLALHPDVSTSGDSAGLAFSAGSTLRYVAPQVPGTYTVFYYAYLEGSPDLLARSQVTITVLPPGANRAPLATDLESRTLAGRSVVIPVPVDSMDPDGDRVVVTSVTQPVEDRLGAVMVGEGGKSLIFYAPEANRQAIGGLQAGGWQAEFTYTVRDAEGQTGTATVRVAVSAQDPDDLAPVTFIDKVRVKQVSPGADPMPIVVEPLLNDRDPADGSLTIGSQTESGLHLLYEVVPNMPGMSGGVVAAGSPYAAAQAIQVAPEPVTAADGTLEYYPDGSVRFEVTEDTAPGTYYFLYTAESLKTRSTAEGVIAITVSPGDAPNQPVIEDTVVTAQTRAQVESGGIDVLSGKVVWPTGDAGSLRIAELGSGAPAGFSFNGARIQGRIPAEGATVPFRVEYGAADGAIQSAWGLLRIPAFDDYRLQVVRLPDAVTELETGRIELAEILGIAPDDVIELNPASAFATHRPSMNEALAVTRCAPATGGGAAIEYTAGYSPGIGSDTCTVDVRLEGQGDDAWSTVVVPIPIRPKDPLAILTPVTKTVNVLNGRITVDLQDELVSWTGGFSMDDAGRRDTMTFTATYGGGSFTVTPSGSPSDLQLTIDVSPTAPVGARETVAIHLDYPWPSDPSLPHFQKDVALVLYVGQVPAQGPSGATLTKACDAKTAEQCQLEVVFPSDQSGQFNPLTGNTSGESTALRLVGVGGGSGSFECPSLGQATAQGGTVRLTLLPAEESKPAGGTCVVPFTVADVRGRTGTGQVTFDVTGFPQQPQAPVLAYSGEGEVRVDVVLGDALRAHPAVSEVRLFEAGALVPASTCVRLDTGTYRCTVTGLANAVHHVYAARTVNSQGDESALSGTLETWAFIAPEFPAGGAPTYEDRVYEAGTTNANRGRVRLDAVCLEHNSAVAGETSSVRYAIGMPGNAAVIVPVDGTTGCTTAQTITINGTGPFTITATPISGAEPPPIGTSTAPSEGGGSVSPALVSHGAPSGGPALTTTWNGTATVTATFAANWNAGDAGAAPPVGTFPQIRFLAWPAADPEPVCSPTINGGGFTELAVSGSAVSKNGTTSATFSVGDAGADLLVNNRYAFKACGTYGYGVAQSTVTTATTLWLFRKPSPPSASPMRYAPASADMNSVFSVTGTATEPVFTWDLSARTDVPDAVPSFVAPTEPPPPGSSWEVRYVAGTSPSTPLPAGSATEIRSLVTGNQFVNWYAQWCFTSGGTDFCSDASTAITPTTQYTGIPFGSSASLALPTQAQCLAYRDTANASIPAAGQQAYELAWGLAAGTQSGWTAGSVRDDAWLDGYGGTNGYNDVDQNALAASYAASDPSNTYANGYGSMPGYDAVYAQQTDPDYGPSGVAGHTTLHGPADPATANPSRAWKWLHGMAPYATSPEGTPRYLDTIGGPNALDRTAAATAVAGDANADATAAGTSARSAWASDQAAADARAQGDAAVAAANADAATIDASTAPGMPTPARNAAMEAALTNVRANPPAIAPVNPVAPTLGGLSTMSGVTVTLNSDPGTHLFTTIDIDFSTAIAIAPFAENPAGDPYDGHGYVLHQILQQYPSGYTCG